MALRAKACEVRFMRAGAYRVRVGRTRRPLNLLLLLLSSQITISQRYCTCVYITSVFLF